MNSYHVNNMRRHSLPVANTWLCSPSHCVPGEIAKKVERRRRRKSIAITVQGMSMPDLAVVERFHFTHLLLNNFSECDYVTFCGHTWQVIGRLHVRLITYHLPCMPAKATPNRERVALVNSKRQTPPPESPNTSMEWLWSFLSNLSSDTLTVNHMIQQSDDHTLTNDPVTWYSGEGMRFETACQTQE